MNSYTAYMTNEGMLIRSDYILVLVHEDNGRFEFLKDVINSYALDEISQLRDKLQQELPEGQHYRIFQRELREVKVERSYEC